MAYRRYSSDYIGAEQAAKTAKRGIWAGTVQPPSEWRGGGNTKARKNSLLSLHARRFHIGRLYESANLCGFALPLEIFLRKKKLYETFIERMDAAVASAAPFEAAWYAYAVLEDRLLSLLTRSGGIPTNKKGDPISMMGPKLGELKKRANSGDSLLDVNLDYTAIKDWKDRRDELMHAMANASKPLADIDEEATLLAKDGVALVRTVCAAARRVKTHRGKGR